MAGLNTLVIPYKPRDAFRAYHDSTKRFSVSVCHRRAGKTVARVNKLIKAAVCNERQYPPARYGYLAPFFVQSKEIAWSYLQHYCAPLISLGATVNQSELSIEMPHNKAVIRLYGAENANRMRGIYFDGVVVDEAQHIARATLAQIILPCLADYQGWLDCSGTPRGWVNLLGELVKLAKDKPNEWFLQVLKASQSDILPPDELARQRAMMSRDEYEQEYECNFDAAIVGAFYGLEMREAMDQGRIGDVPYDKAVPVHTAWDLGYKDDTAIWWYQVIRGEIHVIDFHAVSGASIEDLARTILDKPYNYARHYLPHDARAKTLAAQGRSIIEQLAVHLGISNLAIVADIGLQDGIQAARMMFPRVWFDEANCGDGLDALRQYEREWDDDKKVFREKPKHNWCSHPADAFRMMAVAWREQPEKPQPQSERPLIIGPQNQSTLNDMWAAVKPKGRIRL